MKRHAPFCGEAGVPAAPRARSARQEDGACGSPPGRVPGNLLREGILTKCQIVIWTSMKIARLHRGRTWAEKNDFRATFGNHFVSRSTGGASTLPGRSANHALVPWKGVSRKAFLLSFRHPDFYKAGVSNRRRKASWGSLFSLFQPTFPATTRDSNHDDTTKKVFFHVIRNFFAAQNRAVLPNKREKRDPIAKMCCQNRLGFSLFGAS